MHAVNRAGSSGKVGLKTHAALGSRGSQTAFRTLYRRRVDVRVPGAAFRNSDGSYRAPRRRACRRSSGPSARGVADKYGGPCHIGAAGTLHGDGADGAGGEGEGECLARAATAHTAVRDQNPWDGRADLKLSVETVA